MSFNFSQLSILLEYSSIYSTGQQIPSLLVGIARCALSFSFPQFPKGDMRGALLLSNLQEWSLFPACRLAHSPPLPLCTTSFKATLKRVHRQLHSKEIQSVRTI